jgi:hypothetical protein
MFYVKKSSLGISHVIFLCMLYLDYKICSQLSKLTWDAPKVMPPIYFHGNYNR